MWVAKCKRCEKIFPRNRQPIVNIMTCCDLTMKWEATE